MSANISPSATYLIDAYLQQGLAFHNAGQLDQARSIYQEILKVDDKNFDALQLSGNLAFQTQNFDIALKLLTDALAVDNTNASVYNNRGNVLKALMRLEEALESYDKAIERRHDYALAHSNRGNVLKELNRLEEALACYEQAIEFMPDYAEAYSNCGVALKELNRLEESLASFEKAIDVNPGYAQAFSNRGNALLGLNRLNEALSNYDKAIELKPDYAQAHSNRGLVLQSLNRIEEALLSFEKAIHLKPDYAEAYFNKTLALLLMGDLLDGFEGYEWRWKSESIKKNAGERLFKQPLWLGNESIANKTILLWSEQGLGDSIQFCRYAKLVKSLGARVLLEVPCNLIALLDSLEGVDIFIEQGASLPEFDYQCPLMSLPFAFKTEPNSIPNLSPYLKSNAEKRELWGQRLGEKSKPRIGVVWSGSARHKNDLNRSLKLTQLLDYLPTSFEYVSLQKEVREEDKTTLTNSTIKNYGEQIIDFTDTAALCDLMDLVISVDTSVAHLAGALGKKTWILLPFSPDWRWLLDRDDSPWYESITLYRQGQDREYETVLRRVENDLLKCFL